MANEVKDIGIDVKVPDTVCTDKNCPFHGELSVRGQIIEGVVVSTKMDKTAVVKRNYLNYMQKYERYEKVTSRYSAHSPPCLDVNPGDQVKIMECRPLSKTVSFVIVEKR
jgi:small subunit ribosomal protein S17